LEEKEESQEYVLGQKKGQKGGSPGEGSLWVEDGNFEQLGLAGA
jgi:hypothetical protein